MEEVENTTSVMEQIVDGWKNYIFRNPTTEEMGRERLKKCLTCEWRSKISNRCKMCGCFIPTAVRSTPKKCPINKW